VNQKPENLDFWVKIYFNFKKVRFEAFRFEFVYLSKLELIFIYKATFFPSIRFQWASVTQRGSTMACNRT